MARPEIPLDISGDLPVRDKLLNVAQFLVLTGLAGEGVEGIKTSTNPNRFSWANTRQPGLGFLTVLNGETATAAGFIAYTNEGDEEILRVDKKMDPAWFERDSTARYFIDRWSEAIGADGKGIRNVPRHVEAPATRPEELLAFGVRLSNDIAVTVGFKGRYLL